MSRNQLHKTKVEPFLAHCESLGMKVRRFDIAEQHRTFQLAAIQPASSNNWYSIYWRIHMPEHVTVDYRLDRVLRGFFEKNKT